LELELSVTDIFRDVGGGSGGDGGILGMTNMLHIYNNCQNYVHLDSEFSLSSPAIS
jgi:hypothetical protein